MSTNKPNSRPAHGKHPASKGAEHPHQQDMSGGGQVQMSDRSDGRRNPQDGRQQGGGQGDAGLGNTSRR